MMVPKNSKQKIEINRIDFNNTSFKISKNIIDDVLVKSIKSSGIINPPLLFNNITNNKYIILFGHNRLKVLKDQSVDTVESILIDECSHEEFIEYALLKNYNNEMGPIGKLKTIKLLDDFFKYDHKKNVSLAKKSFNIPEEVIESNMLKKVFKLPENFLDYIDYKNINFKIILKILKLPGSIVSNVSDYIDNENFKVNVFKKVLDLLHDLTRDKKNIDKLKDLKWNNPDENTSNEDYLLSLLQQIRYPEYTSDLKQVKRIIDSFKKNKIEIDFPEFFEDDKIVLKVNIQKKDNLDTVLNRLNSMDRKEIQRLLEFL